jgi:DNA-binding FadR family transcriptional regulator
MFVAMEPRRLYRQVAEQIRMLIDSGELPAGERLPAERELAERFGVSRPTVREALIVLEVEGRVQIRMGSGVYISGKSPMPAAILPDEDSDGPFEILQARCIVESALAEEAARRPVWPGSMSFSLRWKRHLPFLPGLLPATGPFIPPLPTSSETAH